jgi:hypothetical protein
MADPQLDPAQEKESLYPAINTLHQQWGKLQMATAYTDLYAAVARAEQALAILEPQQDKNGIAFKIHVLGFGLYDEGRPRGNRASGAVCPCPHGERGCGPSILALRICSLLHANALPVLGRIGYFPCL